jgi:dihydroorotase
VLLATILSCHALAGDTGWWLGDGQAPHRRDNSHGLLGPAGAFKQKVTVSLCQKTWGCLVNLILISVWVFWSIFAPQEPMSR